METGVSVEIRSFPEALLLARLLKQNTGLESLAFFLSMKMFSYCIYGKKI